MVESFEPSSIETGSDVNSLGEASEQDMVRVSENMKKAQQMGAHIRDDQQKNSELAKFLTYLFGAISDDAIRATAVTLFTRPDQTNLNMTLAIYEMLALFLPFYIAKTEESGIGSAFPSIQYDLALGREQYIQYVNTLSNIYPIYQQLDKNMLSLLASMLLVYHGRVALDEGKKREDFAEQIRPLLA